MTHTRKISLFAASAALVLAAAPAFAALIPSECLGAADVKSCGLQSLVNVFVLAANFIVGISGSLAFIFFIYGGFRWLASGGSPEKIKEGKTIVTNAVIGLVIIFGARAGVDFVQVAITKGGNAPIVGNSCKPTSPSADKSIQPRYFQFNEDGPKCIGSCGELASASGLGYECGQPSVGATCVPNLCEGGANNVCCIKGTSAPAATGAGNGQCSCTGTISAGAFLPNSTFDSYCPQVKAYCKPCGDGQASCNIKLNITQKECDEINGDPTAILPHIGVPGAVGAMLNASGSCTFGGN